MMRWGCKDSLQVFVALTVGVMSTGCRLEVKSKEVSQTEVSGSSDRTPSNLAPSITPNVRTITPRPAGSTNPAQQVLIQDGAALSQPTSLSQNGSAASTASGQPSENSSALDKIRVDRNTILLNESPFSMQGVIFANFLLSRKWIKECLDREVSDRKDAPKNSITTDQYEFCRRHVSARAYYYGETASTCRKQDESNTCDKVDLDYTNGKDGLTLAKKDWNANTIRFNLNQVLLDPENKWHDKEYVKEIQKVVALARGQGFLVIAAIFDGPNQNGPSFFRDRAPPRPIDTDVSLRAIQTLTKLFGSDEGVFFEFLNEPYLPHKDSLENSFKIWINGGTSPSSAWKGVKFVGVNAMIDAVRKLGGRNAIIIQGMRGRLDEIPLGQVKDPLNKLVFAAHPFMNELNWHKTLGLMAKERPVAITAWGFSTQDDWCHQYQGVSKALEAVDYFQKRKLGLVMFGMDAKSSAIRDFESNHPASPTAFPEDSDCTTKDKIGRSGILVQTLFKGEFSSGLQNSPPKIDKISDINTTLGKPAELQVTVVDPDIDPISLRIWWNDGTVDPSAEGLLETVHTSKNELVKVREKGQDEPVEKRLDIFQDRSKYTAKHIYKKPGKYEARVVAFDSKGLKDEQIVRINVSTK